MRAATVFILITVVIDAMGIGLIIPVMPDLVREVTGGDLSRAALWGGVMATSFAVMQFLFSPIVGAMSDKFGRRPVLLGSLAVMAADYVLMALAGSIWLLLLGRIVGGVTAATQATASAYMADVTPPARRASAFGLIGASFGVGFILGPLIGGVLAEYGTRAPFWAAALLAAGNVTFGWCVLRETVPRAHRRSLSWKRANPLGVVRHLGRLPGLQRLLGIYFLYHVAFAVFPAVWAYFTQERYGWGPGTVGMSLGIYGAGMALVQGVLIRPVLKYAGERGAVLAGFFFSILSYALLAVVTSGAVALLLTPLAALAGVIPPALQGIMSRNVAADAQGELQGALTSASSLAMILSPLAMTWAFAAFTRDGGPLYLPGAPFLLALILSLLGVALFLRGSRPRD